MQTRRVRTGRRVGRWGIAGVALVAVVATACSDSGGTDTTSETTTADTTVEEPQSGGNLTIGLALNIDTLNPSTGQYNSSNHSVAKAIFDPIAVLADDGSVVPYLVESIEPNDDFTEWILTIREDEILFSNGDPLTPADLATHIKNVQLGPLTSFGYTTINAVGVVDEIARPAFEAGDMTQEEYDLKSRQVVVYMKEPWSSFPAYLANNQMAYVGHPDYESGEIEDPVGTGPFVMEEWVQDDHAIVVRNENYWREGLPYLDEIEFDILVDPASRYQALEADDVDMIQTQAFDQVADLATDPEVQETYQSVPDGADGDEVTLLMNTQTESLSDVDVRRALQLSTDRAALNDALYDGFYELADAPYRSDSQWYTDPGWPDPDPDEASALVEAWESENGPLSISLTTISSSDQIELSQALAEQWEAAGITVELASTDAAGAGTTLAFGEFDIFMFTYFNGADPDEQYPFWDPNPDAIGAPGEISLVFTRYHSDTQERVMHGGRLTADPDERAALYGELWADFAENVPQIFLFHADWLVLADKDIHSLGSLESPEGAPLIGDFWGATYLTEVWRDQ